MAFISMAQRIGETFKIGQMSLGKRIRYGHEDIPKYLNGLRNMKFQFNIHFGNKEENVHKSR